MIHLTTMASPIGPLTIAARGSMVCMLHFGGDQSGPRAMLHRWYGDEPIELHADPAGAVTAMRDYFAGSTAALDGIEVEMHGTPFQKRVWDALRGVKSGTTTSYAAIAKAIGRAAAVRAVGAANGANPVALIVPCHRIIGTNGSLTGYGGGLERKRWLLAHEGVLLPGAEPLVHKL
jgi:methylated-DNA-[protein]-cysteine S-methyltransferase